MLTLIAALLVALPVNGGPLSDPQFIGMGRQWLYEVVTSQAETCVRRGEPSVLIRVKLNRRGEVAVKFLNAASARFRACVEMLAQPSETFSSTSRTVELEVRLPPEPDPPNMIVDDAPLREPKESGERCEKHADCGSGQACILYTLPAASDAGEGLASEGRCLDFQRWLAAGNGRKGLGPLNR